MTDLNLKFGRRAPKNAPALRLGPALTGTIPSVPASEDYLARLDQWQMLGNDRYGDCVAVTWANVRRLVADELGASTEYPSLEQVITFYETQNPGFPNEDNGMDIQTALETLVRDGGPDGKKAVCFAKVDHTNLEEVEAAIAIFGSVWTGITVSNANQTQFAEGRPWNYAANSPIEGGHSVIVGGYGSPAADTTRFITWAQECEFTGSFWSHQVEEAWVVIWPEHLGQESFLSGVDLAALAADYEALTGKAAPFAPAPGPNPAPTPNPGPAPAPNPEQLLERLADAIVEWADGIFSRWHPTARDAALMDAAKAYIEGTGREFPGTPTDEDVERRRLAG